MSIIPNWFWKSSSLICVRINYYLHPAVRECLTITWLTTTWMSWIQLILLFPDRGGLEQSLVSDLWWLGWLTVSQPDKNIPYYYLYQGPPFYTRDTRHYQQQARKQTHSSDVLNWRGFYDMFELQVRVWSVVSDHLLILDLMPSGILMTLWHWNN